jgi:flagellar hook-associated protein 2
MSKTLTNYKDDLKALEKKLTAIEDRYYKQFAAMETAMAKLNSQSSALASMLGMNVQG